MPQILVGFSEEDKEPEKYTTYAYESNWNSNSKTIEYSYSIKDGENGYLWVKVPEGQFKDIAGNVNVAKDSEKEGNTEGINKENEQIKRLRDTYGRYSKSLVKS